MMRYLKNYNEATKYTSYKKSKVKEDPTTIEEIKATLKDICLELIDDGYKVGIQSKSGNYTKDDNFRYSWGHIIKDESMHIKNIITISITRNNRIFNILTISGYIQRLKDYMSGFNFTSEINIPTEYDRDEDYNVNDYFDGTEKVELPVIKIGERIKNVKIIFTR